MAELVKTFYLKNEGHDYKDYLNFQEVLTILKILKITFSKYNFFFAAFFFEVFFATL